MPANGESEAESEATNTSSEAEDTEEETKSVDFQEKSDKKDDGDDHDTPDPNASSSTGTDALLSSVVVVANTSTDEETFTDAEVLLMLEEANGKADYQKLLRYLEKRLQFYGSKALEVKKAIRLIETNDKKQKSNEEKAIRDAEMKELKARRKRLSSL